MKEDNLKKAIEDWVTTHLTNRFIFWLLFFIFTSLFSYVFYTNVNNSSLSYLIIISLTPSLMVTFLSYLLFKESFVPFFATLIIFLPVVAFLLILYTILVPVGSYRYFLYTNYFTKKCEVRVFNYKTGIPWYATNGCNLTNESKDKIRQYIQVGGGAMKWQDTCQELRLLKSVFKSDYEKILEKDKTFDLRNLNNIKYASSSLEYGLINKVNNFERDRITSLSLFKKDVPNLVAADIISICSLDHFYLGKFRVF